MTTDPVILLVDDSPNDALLLAAVFQRSGFDRPPRLATSGEEAIAYLQGEGRYHDRTEFPLPAVMLLDLNMPRMNGLEVLAWIRRQPGLGRMAVYILSASSRREDINRAYALGANAFLVKPGRLDELTHLAKTLLAWVRLGHFATTDELGEDLEIPVPLGLAGHHSAR